MTKTLNEEFHYFNSDETQLHLEVGEYVEYYSRYIHCPLILRIVMVFGEDPSKSKMYIAEVVSGNSNSPFWNFRGLACNTRRLDTNLLKVLYE